MIEGVTVLSYFQETYLVSMGRVKKGRSRMDAEGHRAKPEGGP